MYYSNKLKYNSKILVRVLNLIGFVVDNKFGGPKGVLV